MQTVSSKNKPQEETQFLIGSKNDKNQFIYFIVFSDTGYKSIMSVVPVRGPELHANTCVLLGILITNLWPIGTLISMFVGCKLV